MAFDGNGTYTPPSPEYPAVSGTIIYADDWNTIISDIATALTNCLTRDGQSPALANISLGGFKLTGLAEGTAAGDALRWEQLYLTPGSNQPSPTEISYLDGVTSAVQTQLDTEAAARAAADLLRGLIAGQAWTGSQDFTGATITVLTQAAGDSTTKAASTAFVMTQAFSTALPAQAGNAGKFVTTDGTNASWAGIPPNLWNYQQLGGF